MWGARIGLAGALAAAAWFGMKAWSSSQETRVIYMLGDAAVGMVSLDATWTVAGAADGRAFRTKSWTFAPERPAPRGLEDLVELRPGSYSVELMWIGPGGPRSATLVAALAEDAPAGAPLVLSVP